MREMMKQIPNTVTLMNLFCGCLGIIYVLEGRYMYVLGFIAAALVLDYTDGLLAKLLNARSELGRELDSLADAVTFGVLPGTILYVLIEQAIARPFYDPNESIIRLEHAGYLFSLFAALRLAKFNIDTRQSENFLGLATPAATIFVAGLLAVKMKAYEPFSVYLQNEFLLIGITLVLAVLMITEIPMFSLKLKSFRWKGNEVRYIFLLLVIPLIVLLKWASFSAIIILYIMLSIAGNFVRTGHVDE